MTARGIIITLIIFIGFIGWGILEVKKNVQPTFKVIRHYQTIQRNY